MILPKYFVILLMFLSSNSFSQSDSANYNTESYQFTPRIAGGQIEAVTYYVLLGFGGLADIDLISKKSSQNNTFGLRFGLEYYAYFDENGGPFTDYCLYGRHTIRMNDFWLTFLGGIAYHTYNATYYEDELLFRLGLEFKYNLIGNYLGLLLKGSTSFREQTTYFGLGIFVGYFE